MITTQQVKNLRYALLESNRATKWDYKKNKIVLTSYYQRLINELEDEALVDEMCDNDILEKLRG